MSNKVVFNACYGGWSLSPLAWKKLGELKGFKTYLYKGYFEDGKTTYIKVEDEDYVSDAGNYIVTSKDFGKEISWIGNNSDFYDYILDRNSITRHDPDLIKVIEDLGEKANGICADLKIRTIDSNKYRICDYDGEEWIETPEDQEEYWITIQ